MVWRSGAACYTDFEIVDKNNVWVAKFHCPIYPDEKLVEALFHQMFINGSTMLIRKKCFEKYGYFDETLHNTQDADYWIRLACETSIRRDLRDTLAFADPPEPRLSKF